jgi:L,D-peptidoglycan transpeptidase YkuD (ErfK/YbiS/YcfS/YnhG family)
MMNGMHHRYLLRYLIIFCTLLWVACIPSKQLLQIPEVEPDAEPAMQESRQAVVVVSEEWTSTLATLTLFQRPASDSAWRQEGSPLTVAIGGGGMAWGNGIQQKIFSFPMKREGDRATPAGIFQLPYAFGYQSASSLENLHIPYVQLTTSLECVDDPGSRFYNRIVDGSTQARRRWKSSEQMRRDDDSDYKLGVVVAQNYYSPIPYCGSCVFIHVSDDSLPPTYGCTALPIKDMERLVRWLDAKKHPVLIALPRDEYRRRQKEWDLPGL